MSLSKNSLKHLVFETLMALGGKKGAEDSIKFIKKDLLIKNSDGIEYTVDSVQINDEEPVVRAYRYDPSGMRVLSIEIPKSEFKKYEPV